MGNNSAEAGPDIQHISFARQWIEDISGLQWIEDISGLQDSGLRTCQVCGPEVNYISSFKSQEYLCKASTAAYRRSDRDVRETPTCHGPVSS